MYPCHWFHLYRCMKSYTAWGHQAACSVDHSVSGLKTPPTLGMCPLVGDGCWYLFHKPFFDAVLRIRITLMRIRILPFPLMRSRILLVNLMRIWILLFTVMRILVRILPFTLMQIRIRLLASKKVNLKKCSNRLIFQTFCLVTCKLIKIRIQFITLTEP
jgi:hypothetical protein